MNLSKATQQTLVFNIKRYAINDGPGVRVTIFFKGCPLSCKWCHNPESHAYHSQRMYNKNKCIGCKTCIVHCPENALKLTPVKGIVVNHTVCNNCGICAEVCPTKATEMSGQNYTQDNLMSIILKEENIMDTSGGGVTFSGGEPLMFPEILKNLLIQCGQYGIHRAVDTSGYAKPLVIKDILAHTDLFLYDIKHMDTHIHKKWTGTYNERILSNLELIANHETPYHIRIPLVKGVNTDDTNIQATAHFINSLKTKPQSIALLPYHEIAEKKYEKLGKIYDNQGMIEPSEDEINHIISLFANSGLKAQVGG